MKKTDLDHFRTYGVSLMSLIKRLICLIIVVSCIVPLPEYSNASQLTLTYLDFFKEQKPLKIHAKTTREIISKLYKNHYKKEFLDDHFSNRMFDNFLSYLDSSRVYLMEKDIEGFASYRFTLDDTLKIGNLDPAYNIFNLYQKRLAERYVDLLKGVDKTMDAMEFDKDETFETDREKAAWITNSDAMNELWRKRTKASVLNLKLAGKSDDEIKKILRKRYQNKLNQVSKTNAEDIFQLYMNALGRTFDPHTQYFSPIETENFNIHMSLSFEGIGAFLQVEDEYTVVKNLVPAGPAEKSNQLKPLDRIIGVGQGEDGEMVDVVGWRIDDVVQHIRGPKGTTVRLEVIPADLEDEHKTKTVKIQRGKVQLEEQSAKKGIIKIEHNGKTYKIGIIDIPTFYLDYKAYRAGDPYYKSTTRDVQSLVVALKREKVDGMIIDLRDNGGGSLKEANELTGLFIKSGPTVQIRDANGHTEVLQDPDPLVYFEGPLAVLTDRMSASASEIFAGAIQDYRRGIIIGGETFGKGTVQSLISLTHGQLKATSAKFYRISGDSTQENGIVPDVIFPTLYDKEKIGESSFPETLSWDSVPPADYVALSAPFDHLFPNLRDLHNSRAVTNPDFIYLNKKINHLKTFRGKTRISLNEKRRKKEHASAEKQRLEIENEMRLAKNMKPLESLAEVEKEEDEQEMRFLKTPVTEDPFIAESGHILIDFLNLQKAGAVGVAKSESSKKSYSPELVF